MNIEILIPIAVIIGCILLIIIKSSKNEHFLSEIIESDIILPNPVPIFQYDLDPKKDLIIGSNDKNNNFPIADIKIVPPKINNNPPKKDEAFKDNNFIPKSLLQGILIHIGEMYDKGTFKGISEDLQKLYQPYKKVRI